MSTFTLVGHVTTAMTGPLLTAIDRFRPGGGREPRQEVEHASTT